MWDMAGSDFVACVANAGVGAEWRLELVETSSEW